MMYTVSSTSHKLKLDTQDSILNEWKSKLDTKTLKIDSQKFSESRIEFPAETVSLQLSDTMNYIW